MQNLCKIWKSPKEKVKLNINATDEQLLLFVVLLSFFSRRMENEMPFDKLTFFIEANIDGIE